MKTIYNLDEMAETAAIWRQEGQSIGLVHFQGNLHRGHASLLKAAKAENDQTVLCLFALDGTGSADLEQDARKAEASGADVLFLPSRYDLWPEPLLTRASFGELSGRLFGSGRPDLYPDLCTLALKLFHLTQAQRTYYGQKDIQRFLLVRRMAGDLNIPVKVACLPIARDQDNLALSAANALLDDNQRRQAALIYSALQLAAGLYAEGQRETAAVLEAMARELRKALLGDIKCLQAVDTGNLLPQQRLKSGSLIALEMDFNGILLSDNMLLD